MGWKFNVLLFVVMLLAMAFDAWIIFIPIAVFFAVSWIRRQRRAARPDVEVKVTGRKTRSAFPNRFLLGLFLLLVAFAALMSGGVYSPIVYASAGFGVIFSQRIEAFAYSLGLAAQRRSILLRSKIPFLWVAVAEVKLATRNPERALAGVDGRILLMRSGKPSVYLIVKCIAFGRSHAQTRIHEKLRSNTRTLAPLGAYLLPLHSSEALKVMHFAVEPMKVPRDEWSTFLSFEGYDALLIEAEGGFARSLRTYREVAPKNSRGSLLGVGQRLSDQPLVWEVFRNVSTRMSWPKPDEYAAFLSSFSATQNLPLGQRIVDSNSHASSDLLSIRALNTPPVELSPEQLRTIVRIYG
jgi:hypothetical protein